MRHTPTSLHPPDPDDENLDNSAQESPRQRQTINHLQCQKGSTVSYGHRMQAADLLPNPPRPVSSGTVLLGRETPVPWRGTGLLIAEPDRKISFTSFDKAPPSSRVASDLLSLSRSMCSRIIGLITGHGHPRKHLHRVCILQEDPLGRMCDEQDETAEHLLFDWPTIPRE
ncbi:hypothetical protein J6590_032167 [Homalodisca vitripennis]|nr:hypothetical protein J6590_032167 [Homalodisca vitripennis]